VTEAEAQGGPRTAGLCSLRRWSRAAPPGCTGGRPARGASEPFAAGRSRSRRCRGDVRRPRL